VGSRNFAQATHNKQDEKTIRKIKRGKWRKHKRGRKTRLKRVRNEKEKKRKKRITTDRGKQKQKRKFITFRSVMTSQARFPISTNFGCFPGSVYITSILP
jgi:hypothetical protein